MGAECIFSPSVSQ
jgi:putative component of toxin-antitoxin plasmid stabilization module